MALEIKSYAERTFVSYLTNNSFKIMYVSSSNYNIKIKIFSSFLIIQLLFTFKYFNSIMQILRLYTLTNFVYHVSVTTTVLNAF